ncbi:hypothetical protein RI054_17g80860 [Pseudoscourfieldia marina]
MIIPPNPVATIQRADAVEVSDSVFADSDTGFDSVRFGFSYGGADSDSGAVAATLEPRGWWDTTAPFARCRDRQLPPPPFLMLGHIGVAAHVLPPVPLL